MRRSRVRSLHRRRGFISLPVCVVLGLLAVPTASAAPSCHGGRATRTVVGRPTARIAWRAGLLGKTSVYAGSPGTGARQAGWVALGQASWLLALNAVRGGDGRCWVQVRLPMRPNAASGWIPASDVLLRPTPWRLVISRASRTLTVVRGGVVVRRMSIVIGAPATPTPTGLFSIIGAWRSPPNAFLGSWILPLTAHSDALRTFDGGDGTVGIHGRGGTSLLAPLGSARSHGCIRLANSAIDWLVRLVGTGRLAGIPVRIR